MKLFTRVKAAIILAPVGTVAAIILAPVGTVAAIILAPVGTVAAIDLDPCVSDRASWQADKENSTLLERWNQCLERAETAKQKAVTAEREEAAARAKRPGAKIGMTTKQVTNGTHWGQPDSVNSTVTARGVREQWVYGGGHYLYFENGRLVAIQTSN